MARHRKNKKNKKTRRREEGKGERWSKKYVDKRNWKEYNETLVKRGEMYLSLDFLETWEQSLEEMNRDKIGAQFEYPEPFIIFLGFIHLMLRVDYRGLEGFTRGLAKFAAIAVPDFSTINRRVNKIRLQIQETLLEHKEEDVIVSLDASGVKVANRGEWMRQVWKVRRGWIKVHIAVEHNKKQCVAIEVTDDSVGDPKKFKPLVKKAQGNLQSKGARVAQANADGAYDTRDCFNTLDKLGIKSGIKIRKNASTRARGSPLRRKHAREYKELGYRQWANRYSYGYRWDSEGNLSAVKRKTGEHVMASKRPNMFKEVEMKFLFYNTILKFDNTSKVPWGKK